MQTRRLSAALACGLLLASMSGVAHADVVALPRTARLTLGQVTLSSSTAPRADAEATRVAASQALYRITPRIRRCVQGANLRRDPLRARSTRLVGRLEFNRSQRATFSEQSSRMPAAAAACVREAVRSIRVSSPAPRGTVVVEFDYRLR